MAKTMQEVLVEHYVHGIQPVDEADLNGPWEVECNCNASPIQGPSYLGAEQAFAAHQAAALSAAGYGLVADAKREAWDEGMQWTAQLLNGDELIGSFRRDNPYQEASNDDQ